jgi:hypothetical protein
VGNGEAERGFLKLSIIVVAEKESSGKREGEKVRREGTREGRNKTYSGRRVGLWDGSDDSDWMETTSTLFVNNNSFFFFLIIIIIIFNISAHKE